MNPHFIFNALNSVQYYISLNKKYEANVFLADFAQVIRNIFENSKKGLIPLHKEIDVLKTYVSLEKMRFKDKLDVEWEINIQNKETLFPTMIVQPFVENAIWHGITPLKERKGRLIISCMETDHIIEFKIEDNGKGMNQLQKESNEKHQSSGIQITKDRLRLYEKEFNKKMSYYIRSSEQGTVVTIQISKIEQRLWN